MLGLPGYNASGRGGLRYGPAELIPSAGSIVINELPISLGVRVKPELLHHFVKCRPVLLWIVEFHVDDPAVAGSVFIYQLLFYHLHFNSPIFPFRYSTMHSAWFNFRDIIVSRIITNFFMTIRETKTFMALRLRPITPPPGYDAWWGRRGYSSVWVSVSSSVSSS